MIEHPALLFLDGGSGRDSLTDYIMRKKKPKPEEQTLEIAAQRYRDCVMSSGDIDKADRILAETIRPPCEQLMRSYGILWDSTLDSFLNVVLLRYSRFDGEKFLSFFLRSAQCNFNMPTKPINRNKVYLHGTGLSVFLQKWESNPERIAIPSADKEARKRKRAEQQAIEDYTTVFEALNPPEPPEPQED